MHRARLAISSSLFVLSIGCGYVGPIQPPSPQIPAQVKDLAAVQRGGKIEIAFHTPPRTTDNISIKKFLEIDLSIGAQPTPFNLVAWEKTAKPFLLPIPPPNDPLDPKPLPVTASLPIEDFVGKHVSVAVRTAVKEGDHYSSWSNRIELDVTEPVSTPADVKIAASAAGVVVSWSPVASADHYRILRQAPNEKAFSEVGSTQDTNFIDAGSQFDVAYSYQVVALNAGAESAPTPPLQITPVDTFPPAVPSGVAALAGPESIELSWQRSPEADTAGYYIYRSVDGSPFTRLGDRVTLPTFSDRNIERGKTYRYQITAVDQKNNESDRSAIAEVSL